MCVGCERGSVRQHGPAAERLPRTFELSGVTLPAGGATEREAGPCQEEQGQRSMVPDMPDEV